MFDGGTEGIDRGVLHLRSLDDLGDTPVMLNLHGLEFGDAVGLLGSPSGESSFVLGTRRVDGSLVLGGGARHELA